MKKQMKIIPLSDVDKLSIEQLEYLVSKGYQLVNDLTEKLDVIPEKVPRLKPILINK